MSNNFDTKFGAPPMFETVPIQDNKLAIIMLQVVLSCVILLTIQPPFVLVKKQTEQGTSQYISTPKVAAISALTACFTVAFHVSKMNPMDTFTGGCEFIYTCIKS